MSEKTTIKGGAGEFEAAVIAVVVEQLEREEKAARSRADRTPTLPAWVRAVRPDESNHPLDPWKPGA